MHRDCCSLTNVHVTNDTDETFLFQSLPHAHVSFYVNVKAKGKDHRVSKSGPFQEGGVKRGYRAGI